MNLSEILIPLYLLISLGYLLNRLNFPSTDFWLGLEQMIYYILFPSLLFISLSKAQIDGQLLLDIVLIIALPTLLMTLTQWPVYRLSNTSPATFTSMFQGVLRQNTLIGLVIAPWIVPDNGLTIMAILILIMVPLNNLASVFVLNHYLKSEHIHKKKWWKGIISNPLILACTIGLLFNLLAVPVPTTLIDTAEFLGKSALPLALLAVGAGLKFNSVFSNKLAIVSTSIAKLIALPGLVWGICYSLDIDTDTAKIAIIFAALPTATSAYILAKQLGGDAEAMAQILTFQTLAAAVTMPVFLLIAQNYQ